MEDNKILENAIRNYIYYFEPGTLFEFYNQTDSEEMKELIKNYFREEYNYDIETKTR